MCGSIPEQTIFCDIVIAISFLLIALNQVLYHLPLQPIQYESFNNWIKNGLQTYILRR